MNQIENIEDFAPESVVLPRGHFIGGSYVDVEQATIEVRRPSDGIAQGAVPDGDAALVDRAVRNAHQALKDSGWSRCSPRDRAKAMRRWADLIESNALQLGQLEAVSSTRPIHDCIRHEVPFTAEAIRFFAECADKYSGDVLPTRAGSLGMLVAEPYGVVGAIAPWNFPMSMASWKCGPALAAGNAVVLKPSELTPFSTMFMAELAVKAGIPAGIFNVVNGFGTSTGSALVRHPLVRKVSFTGSTATGAVVMSDAAHHGMKPVTLELGGKSPQLVFQDAGDLSLVATRIARGFTSNAGQACVAGTRLIVHKEIANSLVEKIIAQVTTLRPGLTWKASTRYAPLINQRQAKKVDEAIKVSVAAGARVLTGGGFFDGTGDGYFYQPTILDNVDEQTPAVYEEIFGPVLTVQIFEDDDEGIAMAGHPIYGLAAGVHTQSIQRALRASQALEAGTVWVNRYGRTYDFIIPTGGFNGSGMGKDLGRQAFEGSLRTKSVLIDFD